MTMDLTNHPSTALTFTENHHGNAVLLKLYEQLAESRYCDVVLHVQGVTYSAHRCVLASCSPYFEAQFKESGTKKEHLSISSHQLETFETVFTYIYTGTVVIDYDTVGEILRLSNSLMLRELKGYCTEYLERSLQVNNVYSTLDIAEKWNLEPLSKNIHGFILANLMEVLEQDEILGFDEYRMEGFISNKSFPLTEETRIHVICRWVAEDVVGRHLAFQRLIAHIQWPRLTNQTLYTVIETERLFSESEYCIWYILQLLQQQRGGLLQQIPGYSERLVYLDRQVKTCQTNEQMRLSQQKQKEVLQQQQQEEDVKDDGSGGQEVLGVAEDVLDEPKLLLVDQTMGDNKDHLIIDEDSDDIPLDYTSDNDVMDHTTVKDVKDKVVTETTMTFTPSELCKLDDAIDVSEMPAKAGVEETAQQMKSESVRKIKTETPLDSEREKHKRKGRPVKLRIPKSRLKMTISNVTKKRGRPMKSVESKKKSVSKRSTRRKTEVPKLETVPIKRVKQEVLSTQSVAPSDSDVADNVPVLDDSDVDQSYKPPKQDRRTKSKVQRVRLHKKRNQRRKKLKQEKSGCLYQCEHCSAKCEDDVSLLSHLQTTHPDAASYSCSKCGFNSLWNREYYKHMRTHFSGPPYKCDYEGCDHVTERIQPLIYHRMRHTDERPFLCSTCNMKFRTKNNLATHMRCHTGEKPWNCDVCSRSFATKGTLEQHSVIHSESRPYLCDTCGFSTKYQSHLIAHKRIHTGDVFRCQYPNCTYSTPKRSQLACHMRSHMSIRQHICAVCSRAFVEKSHLVRHERIHLEDKPFKCPLCDYSSTRRDKLKEHTNKYHGEKGVKSQYKPRKPRKQSFDPQSFPDYSQEGALRVQQQFNGQMEKSVQQRNQVHSQIVETKERNSKQPPAVSSSSLASEEFTQLLSAEVAAAAAAQSGQQELANENAVIPPGMAYSDGLTAPMVIAPNSGGIAGPGGNILLGNVVFPLDSRNLGFLHSQGGGIQSTVVAGPPSGVGVTTTLPGGQVLGQDSLGGVGGAMVSSYASLGVVGSGGMPLIALSSSGQPIQTTTTTDLSQLPNLSAGFF